VAFGILGTAIVVIVVPVYIACNIACIGYFARHRKDGAAHLLSHIVVPIIGASAADPRLSSAWPASPACPACGSSRR
jgi:hypothetical protein